MNREFLKLFLQNEDFPQNAQAVFQGSADRVIHACTEKAFDSAVDFFRESGFNIEATQKKIDELAGTAGISPYTVWSLLLTEASIPVRESFIAEGREDLYWATFADLKYKALECKEIYDEWGTFVAFWYPIFYTGNIVKLGRLEYETAKLCRDCEYSFGGFTIKKDDDVLNMHIPSSGEPFDEKARLESYKKAYNYFKDLRRGSLMFMVCDSWLLYPDYAGILAPNSNILSFQRDFEIIGKNTDKEFGDAWRLFGRDYKKPLSELPERTSMQRAFKTYLLNGGTTGEGMGVMVFDGEKIVNR